jgi:hypothetical protein
MNRPVHWLTGLALDLAQIAEMIRSQRLESTPSLAVLTTGVFETLALRKTIMIKEGKKI